MIPISSVWHVARECSGIAESGGVKDVVRGLADAAAAEGAEVTILLPYYGSVAVETSPRLVAEMDVPLCHHDPPWPRMTERACVLESRLGDLRIWLVDTQRYREKNSPYVYTSEDQATNPYKERGTGHWDVHQMY